MAKAASSSDEAATSEIKGGHFTYALSDWTQSDLDWVDTTLKGLLIPHWWEGGELVVPEGYESRVDDVIERAGVLSVDSDQPDTTTAGAALALVGGAMMVVGTVMPWVTAVAIITVNRNAFQLGANDTLTLEGPIVLLFGIVTLVIGITRLRQAEMPRYFQRSSIVTGLLAGIVVALDYPTNHPFEPGYGYWVCAAGALVAVVGGIVLRKPAAFRR